MNEMVSSSRKAKVTGILLISGMAAGMLSVAPAIDAPDFLIKASANAIQITIGAIFQFVMAIAYLGVAVALYPLLRKFNESLALGFLSFRIASAVFIIIGAIFLLLILNVSQEFAGVTVQDSSQFQILGNLLRTGRDLVNHVFMILALSVGSLMFYLMLFQTRLVPRWLSVWGLSGTTLSVLASLLVLFRSIDIITPFYLILNMPTAFLDLIFAIWLIVKGLDDSAIASVTDN